MIRYHGGPITPEPAALAAWKRSHAMVSFANPEQVALAFAVADSVTIDNGAYPIWSAGKGEGIDVGAYSRFVQAWMLHPAFDWCLIPDLIDGTEQDNRLLLDSWMSYGWAGGGRSVPVWHMHESLEYLEWLVAQFPRVAIGSSGEYAVIGTQRWWARISEAMTVCCDANGYPLVKLHGLRQMDPEIF